MILIIVFIFRYKTEKGYEDGETAPRQDPEITQNDILMCRIALYVGLYLEFIYFVCKCMYSQGPIYGTHGKYLSLGTNYIFLVFTTLS